MVSGFRPLESKKGTGGLRVQSVFVVVFTGHQPEGELRISGCQFVYESLLEDLAVTCHAQARYFRVSQCSTARSMSDSQLLEGFWVPWGVGWYSNFSLCSFGIEALSPKSREKSSCILDRLLFWVRAQSPHPEHGLLVRERALR